MPSKPPRPCRAPMCPGRTTEPHGFCKAHESLASGWAKQGRQTAEARGYGWQWRQLRLQVLGRDRYLCQPCLRNNIAMPANEVDHIKAKANGGTDSLENLQAICSECHRIKTQAEALAARKA